LIEWSKAFAAVAEEGKPAGITGGLVVIASAASHARRSVAVALSGRSAPNKNWHAADFHPALARRDRQADLSTSTIGSGCLWVPSPARSGLPIDARLAHSCLDGREEFFSNALKIFVSLFLVVRHSLSPRFAGLSSAVQW
jgi:hypothetical protein